MDEPCSTSRCSSQLRARCSTGLCRDKRWQNSATNELDSGRSDLAMSATTMTRWDGFFSAMSCKRSTHRSARSRSSRAMVSRVVTRWRFSISPRRSMIGMAHNSPSFREATVW